MRSPSQSAGVGCALLVLAAVAATLPYSFAGDVRYEMGAKAVSGYSAAGTFTHRPLLYRLLSAAITAPAQTLAGSIPQLEVILRAECIALALLAGWVLWLGLRRSRVADAAPVALTVAASLVLMGPLITLEPEWLAVLLTVLGLGVALAVPHRLAAAFLGGTVLAAAAATKIVTLPLAVIGLLALVLLDRRRALATTIAAAAAGLAYLVAVLVWVPHEISWLLDMRSVQLTDAPLTSTVSSTAELLGNAATLWPAVALLPAALVAAPRRLRVAALAAVVLAWLPAQVQGQYFIYHLAALPVVAAAVLVLALRRAPASLAFATLGCAAWGIWASSTPYSWRSDHTGLLFAGTAAAVVGAWLYRLRAARPNGPVRPATAVVAVLVTSLAASTPFSAGSISLQGTKQTTPLERLSNTRRSIEAADRIRARIGPDTPVTYLTFGTYPYFLGNPASCRYPSPVFLQRGWPRDGAPPTRAWTEAFRCLTDTPGDWLVWDTRWFKMRRQPAVVQETIARTFDCEHALKQGVLRVCPRRS